MKNFTKIMLAVALLGGAGTIIKFNNLNAKGLTCQHSHEVSGSSVSCHATFADCTSCSDSPQREVEGTGVRYYCYCDA